MRLGADPAELEEAKSEEEKPTFPPHVPNPFLEKESFLASLMLPASSQIDRARLLDNVAWHLASVAKWAGKNVLGGKLVVPKKLLMASLCSGSGGGELAAHAVTTALGKIFDQECTCQCALVCEAVAYKAQHLCSLVSSLQPAASFCCFDDVVELGTGVGTCRTHHNIVKPPKGAKKGEPSPSAKCPLAYSNERQESDLHGALSGFSCKSFSKQNSQFKVLMSAMTLGPSFIFCNFLLVFDSTSVFSVQLSLRCFCLLSPGFGLGFGCFEFCCLNVGLLGHLSLEERQRQLQLSENVPRHKGMPGETGSKRPGLS